MRFFIKSKDLISKIEQFNEVFSLDLSLDDGAIKWTKYLDPVSLHLFGISYIDFIKSNQITFPSPPGMLEKYYNFFVLLLNNLKHLTSFEVPNEIYCSTLDVLETFQDFLKLNNFFVKKEKTRIRNTEIWYHFIFPAI